MRSAGRINCFCAFCLLNLGHRPTRVSYSTADELQGVQKDILILIENENWFITLPPKSDSTNTRVEKAVGMPMGCALGLF